MRHAKSLTFGLRRTLEGLDGSGVDEVMANHLLSRHDPLRSRIKNEKPPATRELVPELVIPSCTRGRGISCFRPGRV